jgi:hypothetical protein
MPGWTIAAIYTLGAAGMAVWHGGRALRRSAERTLMPRAAVVAVVVPDRLTVVERRRRRAALSAAGL